MTTDEEIHEQISALVAEEKTLRERISQHEGSPDAERSRLHQVEVELDQLWDLLRQRKAKGEFGESPDEAAERSPGVVENYLN
jgi:predicted nuclease with TOPRIM domain